MHVDAFTCSLAFQSIFRLLMVLQGTTGRNCLTLPCPIQGLPLSKGVRWPAGSSISCHAFFPVLYFSSTQYFFFFCQVLNLIWPCLDWRMASSHRRIYKGEEPAERNESGVRKPPARNFWGSPS